VPADDIWICRDCIKGKEIAPHTPLTHSFIHSKGAAQ
jgi:hypothetical protein